MSKFYHTRSPHIRIIHFWGHFRLLYGYNLPHTPTKVSLAVILRGQPSFYDHLFTRYGFCDFFPRPGYFRAISGLFPANRPWPKIWHLLFLTLLESYNQFLKRKWIYMEVHTEGNSWWKCLSKIPHLRFLHLLAFLVKVS